MKIVIVGKPIPWQRPRLSKSRHFFNKFSAQQEKVSFEIKAQYNKQPSDKPIQFSIFFFMPIPTSLSKKKKTLLRGQPCVSHTGDIDNYCKFYLDAANNVLYKDDAQVYKLVTQKVYSERPRVEIIILEYKDE